MYVFFAEASAQPLSAALTLAAGQSAVGTADLEALRARFAQHWAELEADVSELSLSEAERAHLNGRIKQLEQENARLRHRLAEAEMGLAMRGLSVRYVCVQDGGRCGALGGASLTRRGCGAVGRDDGRSGGMSRWSREKTLPS